MHRTEDGAIVGSLNVAELSDAEKAELGIAAANAETSAADAAEAEDLSKLYKADLVAKAEAAGLDPTGLKKADLVAALESDEVVDDGNDDVS